VYGASALTPRGARHGIAQALAAGPPDTVLVTVFLDGGVDALSVLFPHGDPEYRRLRPKLALADSGLVFPEDTRLRWHPSRSRSTRCTPRASSRCSRDRLHERRTSRTSRRATTGRSGTPTRLQTGWLGRYLDHVGTADNPLQGVSLDGELSPSLATAKKPVAALSGPATTRSVAERVGQGRGPDARGDRRARLVARPRPALRDRARGHVPVAPPAPAARAVQAETSRRPCRTRRRTRFPQQLAGLAAMLGAGLPLHCVALSANGGYDTHSDQAQDLSDNLDLASKSLLAFQRDLEARGSPTAC
jgi:uncharacterized protein (DUF1501 family)